MSLNTEAPALIQYACERCKTRFVLPPSSRKLSPPGRIKATMTAIGRMLRYHEGYSVTYDGVRRQMLAKMDDDAYQSFVQSFKFCHECRQFVCSECWSNSRKTCLGCFAKAAGTSKQKPPYAPDGPVVPRPTPAFVTARRKRRVSTQASLLVMAAAVLLLVVELAIALPGQTNGNQNPSASTPVAGVTQTGTPEPTPTADATATPTPTATPSPSPTESPTESPSPTPAPTPTPRPATPKPTAFPLAIKCNGKTGEFALADGVAVTCTWSNYNSGIVYTSASWYNSAYGAAVVKSGTSYSYTFDCVLGPGVIKLKVIHNGVTSQSNLITIGPTSCP